MNSPGIQQLFFQEIKSRLPSHISLVDKVADVLNISIDSSYRRIRGEKSIDFEELKTLSLYFKLSIDQFIHLQQNSVLFEDHSMGDGTLLHYNVYLEALIRDLTYMNSLEHKTMYYLNKDVPIFHHFSSPALTAFKSFFWVKSIMHDPEYARESFSLDKYVPLFESNAKKINQLYKQLPSVEIWNIESINSSIRQIEYYRNIGLFKNRQEIEVIYNSLEHVINEIEGYAETGEKKSPEKALAKAGSYQIYINEFILGDNTIMLEMDKNVAVYINHAVINYMLTRDLKFCSFTKDHFENIIKKSTPISNTNEKERTRFFNRIREKIQSRRLIANGG